MRYINFYPTSGAAQTAIENGELGRPFVIYVEEYSALVFNTLQHVVECYVEDSDGNIYFPTGKTEEGGTMVYSFDFQADVDATWTLYHMGNVVEVSSGAVGTITWFQECNEHASSVEQILVAGAPIANIAPSSPISYDEPIQHITADLSYGGDAYDFHAFIYIPYCGEDPSSSGSES